MGFWFFLSLPVIAFCLGVGLLQVSVNGTVNTRGLLGDREYKTRVLESLVYPNSRKNCRANAVAAYLCWC